jgi:hypothetical protein
MYLKKREAAIHASSLVMSGRFHQKHDSSISTIYDDVDDDDVLFILLPFTSSFVFQAFELFCESMCGSFMKKPQHIKCERDFGRKVRLKF